MQSSDDHSKHDQENSTLRKEAIFNLDVSSISIVDQSNFLTNMSISEKGDIENFDLSEIIEETENENSVSNSILNHAFLDEDLAEKLPSEKNNQKNNIFEKNFLELLNNCEYFRNKEMKCKINLFLNKFLNEDKENNKLSNLNVQNINCN